MKMEKVGNLVFHNRDATPKTTSIVCSIGSVRQIMAWYGCYYAGDKYTVSFDGDEISMDINGEPKIDTLV